MSFRHLTIAVLFLSASAVRAEKPTGQPEFSSIAIQLASVQQQLLSVQVQRQSIAKHQAFTRMPEQTAFLEPLRIEAEYFDCGPLAPRETEKLIATASRRQSLPAELLRAVIRQESAFRPCAISDKGAQGLMQLMPTTAAAFNVSDPFDPGQNISGGAAYLRQLMERYAGDASLALSAYNAGPQLVDRIASVPEIPETQNYVTSIFRDLGWTLPTHTATLPESEPGQAAHDTDIKPDLKPDPMDLDVVSPELGIEPRASNATKDKPFSSLSSPESGRN